LDWVTFCVPVFPLFANPKPTLYSNFASIPHFLPPLTTHLDINRLRMNLFLRPTKTEAIAPNHGESGKMLPKKYCKLELILY
jgi:hypothetical protein